MSDPGAITRLLSRLDAGDPAAAAELWPLVYDELRALAGGHLRRERSGHTLQPTALVHEAYVRLVAPQGGSPRSHAEFRALAGRVMRHILIEHGRKRRAAKRGGGAARVTLDCTPLGAAASAPTDTATADILDLHEALQRLATLDERKARVTELRFFSGLTEPEVAELLSVSRKTVAEDWAVARVWLSRELRRAESRA